MDTSIYLHIPFCESKCIYCDFASFAGKESLFERYVAHLCDEIKLSPYIDANVTSIFIGGGTPSLLNEQQIKAVLDTIKTKFSVASDCEITIECNPNSIDKEKLLEYFNFGINRISFGVQSLDDDVLKFLGRRHNKMQALNAIQIAKDVGFKNVNADLLIGLKSPISLSQQVDELLDAGVTHVSAYML